MAKLVGARGLGPRVRKNVGVRVPPPAQQQDVHAVLPTGVSAAPRGLTFVEIDVLPTTCEWVAAKRRFGTVGCRAGAREPQMRRFFVEQYSFSAARRTLR